MGDSLQRRAYRYQLLRRRWLACWRRFGRTALRRSARSTLRLALLHHREELVSVQLFQADTCATAVGGVVGWTRYRPNAGLLHKAEAEARCE